MSHEVLVLADDLTGALEVGAKFAGQGLASQVTIAPSLAPSRPYKQVRVLVVEIPQGPNVFPCRADPRQFLVDHAVASQGGMTLMRMDSLPISVPSSG